MKRPVLQVHDYLTRIECHEWEIQKLLKRVTRHKNRIAYCLRKIDKLRRNEI